ncbi:hypothetical protein AMTR_s00005p00127320 [Amborella trichopoda]|uniref:Uncharacterized protein n=1 Tax=Amborella trichopoda TaxID=13333 RepID=W1PGE3_AMBTC|nr:hypothetical protein AMTR_s00005p00127320 [Amborella trichopoda]
MAEAGGVPKGKVDEEEDGADALQKSKIRPRVKKFMKQGRGKSMIRPRIDEIRAQKEQEEAKN